MTGTDTGVGKTLVAGALIHTLADNGLRVAGFKPVAAGARQTPAGPRNEDAELLASLASVELPYKTVNPVLATAAMAPHVALAREGRRFDRSTTLAAYASARETADVIVAEGAGGWLVPLGGGYDMASLAADLGLPVLIVVGLRLGCLNHARLTFESVSAHGLSCAGWVASQIDPDMEATAENLASLTDSLDGEPLAVLPRLAARGARERCVAASQQHLSFKRIKELLNG